MNRSRRLGLLFLLLAGGILAAARTTTAQTLPSPVTWLLIWPATSALALSLAYLGLGPKVLGKREDGRLRPAVLLLLAPFFLFTWGVWHAHRLISREPARDEILPGLWLGRRPFAHELPAETKLVVDMTAEFAVHTPIRRAAEAGELTLCLCRTLDGTPPAREGLIRSAREVLLHLEQGSVVYVHCAAGHGRSATVVALVLLRRGSVQDTDQVEAFLRERRPGVHINADQRAVLARALESW